MPLEDEQNARHRQTASPLPVDVAPTNQPAPLDGTLQATAGEGIMALFDELHAEGRTIVMVTHDADVAARAGRCIRLLDGRIVEDRPTVSASPSEGPP